MNIEKHILVVPDFPKEGILFRDVTTLIQNPEAYAYVTQQFVEYALEREADIIVGPEARGFLLGCPVAAKLNMGFVPIRKKGKLPGETLEASYDLEYGSATLEMNKNAIQPGQRVIICDDLLATGGTIEAVVKLIEEQGGIVAGIALIIELTGLNGRDKLQEYDIKTLLQYD